MWSQFPLRLCVAAMAPALTDAAAHTGSFKLPVSPANPGNSGFQASPNQPTSPDLPSITNGHSPTVPGVGKHFSHSHTHTQTRSDDISPSPGCYTIQSCFLEVENNNHKKKEINLSRINEADILMPNHASATNGCDNGLLKNSLNSLISTIGISSTFVANGEGHTIKQYTPKTMNNSVASFAQKDLDDNRTISSATSKMPPLTISSTGSASQTAGKHPVAAGLEGVNVRNTSIGDLGELHNSNSSSSSSLASSESNELDSSMSMSLSTTVLTTDTSIEQAADESLNAKESDSDSDSDSDESVDENYSVIPSEARVEEKCKSAGGCDKQNKEMLVTKSAVQCNKPKPNLNLRQNLSKYKKVTFRVVDDKNVSTSSEEDSEAATLLHKRSKLEHRAKYLVEKLRRLQTCQVGSHVYQQVGSFVESKQTVKEGPNINVEASNGCDECRRNRLQTGGRTGVLARSSSSHSHTCALHSSSERHRHSHSGRPSWLPAGKRTKTNTHIAQHLREGKQSYREVKSVSGKLLASLGHVESTIDSDVTDSSSGGESCDEGDDSLPQSQASRSFHKMPLHRRASWKWAMNRAAIASRWTWLQAQVSDLEYRIRQQSDIFRQIRATKGSVTLGEPPAPEEYLRAQALAHRTGRKLSPLEAKIVMLDNSNSVSPSNLTSLLSNVDNQSARLKQSLQNCISPTSSSSSPTNVDKTSPNRTLNGLMDNAKTPGLVSGSTVAGSTSYLGIVGLDQAVSSQVPVEEQYCARTRPVRPFRKRKLIKSTGLYQVCKKAQKLSTVRCGCFPPLTPCVMCGGRFNNVEKCAADQAPKNERIASLDYAYHSVLSFPEEIPLNMHFGNLLKSGAWQRKHSSRSLGKKKHSKLSAKSRMKVHSKDGRLKKFRKKEKRQQKRRPVKGSGDAPRRKNSMARDEERQLKKEMKEREQKEKEREREMKVESAFDGGEDSGPEDDDEAARSRKLLARIARQKLKALRQVRGDKYVPRSNPSSVPGTPKNSMKAAELRQCRTELKKRRAAELTAALQKSRERSQSLPNIEVGESFTAPSTPTSAEARSPTQTLSHSMPSHYLHGSMLNKKGVEEAYDIDNIVIPYSMFASTRVVRLNYKEIVTPKWRVIDLDELLAGNYQEEVVEDEEEEVEDEEEQGEEDLSDSEYTQRHGLCESVEKQKFLTNAVDHGIPGRRSRRSRNSSIGSMADPQSPDFQLEPGSMATHSVSSTPSPSPMSTPDQLSSSSNNSNLLSLSGNRALRSSALSRRRSSSMSDAQWHAAQSQLPYEEEDMPVREDSWWVKRQFPLDETETEYLATYPCQESEPSTRPSSRASNATPPESVGSKNESHEINFYISDPDQEISDTEPMEVDDPNDPEWTVVDDQHRSRKLEGAGLNDSLVLKLAKR